MPSSLRLSLAFIAGLTCAQTQAAAPIRFSVADTWGPPFAELRDDLIVAGIVLDLVEAIGQVTQRQIVPLVLPRKRIDGAVKSGQVDLRCYTHPGWVNDPDAYYWSSGLFEIPDVIFAQRDIAQPKSLQQIPHGSVIGTVLGYKYEKLETSFVTRSLKREDASDQEKVMAKVAAGRHSYGISSLHALEWALRNSPSLPIAPWRLKVSDTKFQCGVPINARIPAPELLDAIERLKQDGTISRILSRYR